MSPLVSAAKTPLDGVGVLVTRPARQSSNLCRLIEERGGNAICFPAIEIESPQNLKSARRLLDQLPSCDIAIFVSPNAVRATFALIGTHGLPNGLRVAAVGRGSERVLNALGIEVDILPADRYDSESLLRSEPLQRVKGKRIFIFRGVGGRTLLADTLRARGAEVHYVEVYRRVCPRTDPGPLLERWDRDVDIVTVTSQEILENLFRILGGEGGLRLGETPVVVVSERIAERAAELGCNKIELAERADDEAIVSALEAWFSRSTG